MYNKPIVLRGWEVPIIGTGLPYFGFAIIKLVIYGYFGVIVT